MLEVVALSVVFSYAILPLTMLIFTWFRKRKEEKIFFYFAVMVAILHVLVFLLFFNLYPKALLLGSLIINTLDLLMLVGLKMKMKNQSRV